MNSKFEQILSAKTSSLIPLKLLDEYNDFVNSDLREVLRANCLRRYLEGTIDLLLKDKIIQKGYISIEKWNNYNLNNKIQTVGKYYDKDIERSFDKIRSIGNKGSHYGSVITSDELEEGIEIATHIIEKMVVKYFKSNTVGSQFPVLTWLSALPPQNRVYILEEIFNDGQKNTDVIDKLSMAYLKSGEYLKSLSFLEEQKSNKIITYGQYDEFVGKINLLYENIEKFDIAKNVLDVERIFNSIFNSHVDKKYKEFTDVFLVLISGYGFKK